MEFELFKSQRLEYSSLHRLIPIWTLPIDILHNVSNGIGQRILNCKKLILRIIGTLESSSILYIGPRNIDKITRMQISNLYHVPKVRSYNSPGSMSGFERLQVTKTMTSPRYSFLEFTVRDPTSDGRI